MNYLERSGWRLQVFGQYSRGPLPCYMGDITGEVAAPGASSLVHLRPLSCLIPLGTLITLQHGRVAFLLLAKLGFSELISGYFSSIHIRIDVTTSLLFIVVLGVHFKSFNTRFDKIGLARNGNCI